MEWLSWQSLSVVPGDKWQQKASHRCRVKQTKTVAVIRMIPSAVPQQCWHEGRIRAFLHFRCFHQICVCPRFGPSCFKLRSLQGVSDFGFPLSDGADHQRARAQLGGGSGAGASGGGSAQGAGARAAPGLQPTCFEFSFSLLTLQEEILVHLPTLLFFLVCLEKLGDLVIVSSSPRLFQSGRTRAPRRRSRPGRTQHCAVAGGCASRRSRGRWPRRSRGVAPPACLAWRRRTSLSWKRPAKQT